MLSNEDWLIFGSFAGSFTLVAVRTLTLMKGGQHLRTLGPATWDYSSSWASTFTLVGALLGTVLAQSGVLPQPTRYLSSRASYAGLNVAFVIITVLAPLVYTALSSGEPPQRGMGVGRPHYQGFVWGFLLATVLTLWGSLGQVVTVIFLLREIAASDGLSSSATIALDGLLGMSILLFCVYSWRGIAWIVTFQGNQTSKSDSGCAPALPVGPNLLEGRKGSSAPSLPPWHLL